MKEYSACLVPDCSGKGIIRGLCLNHYWVATSLVKTHRTTWEALEKQGKALPGKKKGRPSEAIGWFLNEKRNTQPKNQPAGQGDPQPEAQGQTGQNL